MPRTSKRSIQVSLGVMTLSVMTVGTLFLAAQDAGGLAPPVQLTAQQDRQRIMDLLHITSIPLGAQSSNAAATYDESQANPYPKLPDPLVLNNGKKVASRDTWVKQRRPEILEYFEREVYGRTPKNAPKVKWEVTSREDNGSTITKQLVGHVDNSSYPLVNVDIQLILVTPSNAPGPVPVIMQFGFAGGGRGRGPVAGGPVTAGGVVPVTPVPAPPAATASAAIDTAPGAAPTGAAPRAGVAPAGGRGPNGPRWQDQVLAKGWGYAMINPGSIQADNGAGLTQGIIGLVNRGQPRKLDDWGALAAWAWGASRALDYFETDKAVDAKQVGVQGHSRYGKATIVAVALDPRFAIAYVSSSGAGGAKLHRRKFGESIENVLAANEYHWMAGNYFKYGGNWDALPVDAHSLIALIAPRPVFISAGATNGDGWVDAKGSFLAAVGAGPVYKLLGKKDVGATEFPPIDSTLIDGDIGFRQHTGGHTDAPTWPTFLAFADSVHQRAEAAADGLEVADALHHSRERD